MKTEHMEAIERAKLHGLMPSMLAHELLERDLVEAAMFEWKNIAAPFSKLNEGQQQEVIDRLTEKVHEAVHGAIAIIASRGSITIPCTMKQIKVDAKNLTVTSVVDAKDKNRHGLTDSAGHICLLVLAPDDYDEGLDSIKPERDQHDLPLHVSNLTGSLFDGKPTGADEPDGQDYTPLTDPFYDRAVAFVVESRRATASSVQRELDIGFNRAATLLEAMEQNGVVSGIDHTGAREVLWEPGAVAQANSELPDDLVDAEFKPEGKEFGDFSYEDAAQLVVLHAKTVDVAWLQRRLAIDSDQAITLLLRLVDNQVIELETEAALVIENTYKVIAELANLNLE
ncbi:DNA translocase FtsK [Pseudomonas sp. IT-P4]|uniref:DNA translocase FtsK n=1 Tax=Pseudomonas sp. IT-P4 TaxID=3026446 RepID=UPI0039E1D90B